MRELKFRLWDQSIPAMCPVLELYLQFDSLSAKSEGPDGRTFGSFIKPGDDDVVLMQYTGCLDKNNKEIFEGDIVEVDDTVEGYGHSLVAFNEDEGQWVIKDLTDDFESLYEMRNFVTVVGNLHENPEMFQ